MKKILPVLVLLSVLAVLAVPLVALAQEGPIECCKIKRPIIIDTTSAGAGAVVGPTGGSCPPGIGAITVVTEKWGIFCLLNTINTVIDWIFIIMVLLAVLFTLFGAYNILTAGGSPEKVSTGRTYILYAAMGLIVAFIARAIPSIVKAVLGF